LKKIYTLLVLTFALVFNTACTSNIEKTPPITQKIQDVQVYTGSNTNTTITPKTIENAFESVGLSVPGNNDMNKPFQTRFGATHYPSYNLAMFINNDLTFKLIKKYPSFGALTPLTMSIWTQNKQISIATLTINGMARVTGIPLNDPDLIEYATLIQTALKKSIPNGEFKTLPFVPSHQNKALQVTFTSTVNLNKDVGMEEYIEDFEAEFEGEIESLGFLVPNFTNLQEEIFNQHDYNEYDFYHTYSICKFDVIYPVSKLHPEAGAWAPCSFYFYKKKNEDKMHMGFLSVQNWITSLGIKDEASIKPLEEAQEMLINTIKEITEVD